MIEHTNDSADLGLPTECKFDQSVGVEARVGSQPSVMTTTTITGDC